MANVPASGIEPGQRRLNGPQTTGREYRNLSQPTHVMAQEDDVTVPMRDGINLLADPPISLSRVVTSTSLRIAGEPVDLVAPLVKAII
jgi:hypothetical protein